MKSRWAEIEPAVNVDDEVEASSGPDSRLSHSAPRAVDGLDEIDPCQLLHVADPR
jgi:hypothetical protein